jgi:aspartate/methionine/tyrosine aminotransferase
MTIADIDTMVREQKPGWINLSIGEPVFLQEALRLFYPELSSLYDPGYPNCTTTVYHHLIIDELKEIYPYLSDIATYNFVFTSGAKQAIAASIYAAGRTSGISSVIAKEPYWLSFPSIARGLGMTWDEGGVLIETYPNNPDGTYTHPKDDHNYRSEFRVWDAVYASPVYGYIRDKTDHAWEQRNDVIVGSFSKSFGLSGLRLGWAAFRSPDAAIAAAEYVESTTSGVSPLILDYAMSFLTKRARHIDKYMEAERHAKYVLNDNSNLFADIMSSHCEKINGIPSGHEGMFAWFKPNVDKNTFHDALVRSKITMVGGGKFCGYASNYHDWFRANLGANPEELEEALRRLSSNL